MPCNILWLELRPLITHLLSSIFLEAASCIYIYTIVEYAPFVVVKACPFSIHNLASDFISSSRTGATFGAGTTYYFGALLWISAFSGISDSQSLVYCVLFRGPLFVFSSSSLSHCNCPSFFDLRLLITPSICSSFSANSCHCKKTFQNIPIISSCPILI